MCGQEGRRRPRAQRHRIRKPDTHVRAPQELHCRHPSTPHSQLPHWTPAHRLPRSMLFGQRPPELGRGKRRLVLSDKDSRLGKRRLWAFSTPAAWPSHPTRTVTSACRPQAPEEPAPQGTGSRGTAWSAPLPAEHPVRPGGLPSAELTRAGVTVPRATALTGQKGAQHRLPTGLGVLGTKRGSLVA